MSEPTMIHVILHRPTNNPIRAFYDRQEAHEWAKTQDGLKPIIFDVGLYGNADHREAEQ